MKKILVANRGEIAVRVLQSCREAGIRTVAVFSEADRKALHVSTADEAVCIGPAPSADSYLNIKKIIQVSKELGVEGIHPGYGFLSENAEFARAVTDAGITFIGPPPEAMEIMGSKLAAKKAVAAYDVPMVPGTDHAIIDIAEAKKRAQEIGFPILIKASAGGGGKGMRIVRDPSDFETQMNRAVSEATSAFGDGSVFIEKYISNPRHIEIQVMADSHGNVIHLFERECSIQRRHQKVIEEAPSAIVTPEVRKALGKAACDVARSCGYVGAGTVEFIMNDQQEFFFLEMNTRLQVEHPVTEMVTGIDLVKEQISIAGGDRISFSQEDLSINGHAIELRVYAEDPYNDFLPDIGVLEKYELPHGDGIRVDNGYTEGMEVPIYYDPLLSKLIVHAATRKQAITKMKEAIADYKIKGIRTTLPFGTFVMEHHCFISGNFSTSFVDEYFNTDDDCEITEKIAALMACKIYHKRHEEFRISSNGPERRNSTWKSNRLRD